MWRLAPLLVLLACDGDTDDTDGLVDADGDGWDVLVDCDDDDPRSFPGNQEVCDGVDNDCDGEVDDAAEGTRTFYEDADEDGFGNPNKRVFACYPTGGFVVDGTDCDDADPDVRPGADEVCDGVDNNCDELVDNDPVDGDWWYPDVDRDGFGSDAARVKSCRPIGGHLPTGGDCDDNRATVNPNGIEVCDSRDIDEDCDGLVDDEDDSVTELIPWFIDADGDGFGDRDTPIWQCAAVDGRTDIGGDCRDDLDTVNPDRTEVCGNGLDDNCDDHAAACGVVGSFGGDLAHAVRDGRQAGGAMGMAVLGPGDLDANGKGEVLAAAPLWDKGTDNNTGQLYYFYNPVAGVFSISTARVTVTGVEQYARYGRSLDRADDLTGDGLPELVVGSPGGTPERVYLGPMGAAPGDARLVVEGPTGRTAFGEHVVWIDDMTGDGTGDLWIGAPDDGSGGLRAGAGWLVSGALTGTATAADDATGAVYGVTAGGRCGVAVAAVDLDGDGVPSLLLGCPQESGYAGLVAVFDAAPSGAVDVTDADGTLTAEAARYGAGAALAAVGDVDDDGYDDFVVGSPGAGGTAIGWEGAAYLWLGEVSGTQALSKAETRFSGEVAEDAFGAAVAAGDISGDGLPEVILGAPRYGTDKRGRVYVFAEPASGTLSVDDAIGIIDGEDAIDNFGGTVRVARDATGDGYDDLLVGAHNRDAIGEGSGSVYLFFGGPGY